MFVITHFFLKRDFGKSMNKLDPAGHPGPLTWRPSIPGLGFLGVQPDSEQRPKSSGRPQ